MFGEPAAPAAVVWRWVRNHQRERVIIPLALPWEQLCAPPGPADPFPGAW